MGMNAPHKFLFDQSFDQPDAPRAAAPRRAPAPPSEPTFSKADLEAARQQGDEAGRAAAFGEAAQSTEARIAETLSSVAARVEELLAARQRYADEAQRSACETMGVLLRKVVPALSRRAPLAELEALMSDCLRDAFDEPRIVMRVADTLFEPVQRRLGALTAAAGFAGKVVLLADETLGPGDARVEWAEGGAERDARRLMRDIDGALARALDSIPLPGTSLPEENDHE
jgi:flagellar assembly protein FliH